MAENTILNPGAGGDTFSADEIAGVKIQRVKVQAGVDGTTEGDVATSNPFPVTVPSGELLEAIERLRVTVNMLNRSIGQASLPDVAGRLRVVVDAITGALTLATITTVGTVTSVTTVAGLTNIGGNSATEEIPALMRMRADCLRRNISVS